MILFTFFIFFSKEICKNPEITSSSQLTLFLNVNDREYADCTQIKGQLTIPANCDGIGEESFLNCTGLYGSLIFEHSVHKIGKMAFYNTQFTRIIYVGTDDPNCTNDAFPDDIPIYVSDLYKSDKLCEHDVNVTDLNELINNPIPDMTPEATYIHLEETTTEESDETCKHPEIIYADQLNFTFEVNEKEYAYCTQIEGQLSFPLTLKSIGFSAFQNCIGINGSLEIPGSVNFIDDNAFDGCNSLNGNLVINDGVQKIGKNAFRSTNFLKIVYKGKVEPECGQNAIPSDKVIFVSEKYKNISFCGNQISYIYDMMTSTNEIENSSQTDLFPYYPIENPSSQIQTESIQVTINSGKNKKLSGGAVVGIIIGCVVFIIAMVVLVIYFFNIRKRKLNDELNSNTLTEIV